MTVIGSLSFYFLGEFMVKRISITLEQDEYSALLKVAVDELRSISDQARFIIRSELLKLGLLEEIQSINVFEVEHEV